MRKILNRRTILIAILSLFTTIRLWAVSAELLENANSVIEGYRVDVKCSSLSSCTEKYTLLVTVLNENGADEGNILIRCDGYSSLSKFEGVITDTIGRVIKKITKKDLHKTEYTEALAEDMYYYTYSCYAPQYPYRVKYEWEMKNDGCVLRFPMFMPIAFNQSVVRADYSISVPAKVGLRYKEFNGKGITINESKDNEGNVSLKASMKGIKAIPREPYNVGFENLMPKVMFAPRSFVHGGIKGDMTTWKDFGKWQYALLEDCGVLPQTIKDKVHSMTDTCTSPLSKIKVLYDFLGKTTRYVSIQLGIGGYKPMKAEKVSALGFGDCKGLTNYMRVMLSEVDINSNYTVVSTYYENLPADFSNFSQMDHAILQVPLQSDTLWLECTNTDVPIGYVSHTYAGHNALVITADGGQMVRLPKLKSDNSWYEIDYNVVIHPDFSADIDVTEKKTADYYGGAFSFSKEAESRQMEILRKNFGLSSSEITNLKIDVNKSRIPSVTRAYHVFTPVYGRKSGSRVFVNINPILDGTLRYKCKNRATPIELDGTVVTSRIVITLPEGVEIESMSKCEPNTTTEFGAVTENYSITGKKLEIIQTVVHKEGIIEASKNDDFASFLKQVKNAYEGKMILRKAQ